MWTQNECLGNPEIKRLLGLGRPENIVRVSESVLWVIEAKSSPNHIAAAKSDAYGRATKLNISERFKVMFISGVAGNNTDGFVVQTEYCRNGEFRPITWNDAPVTSLLRHSDLRQVLEHDNPDVETPKIDEALFLSRANAINEELHLGAVNPHQRASVMAALLLSMLADTDPNIGERGGFKWSSQHLDVEVCDGQAVGVVGDADGETGDEVAGASADSSGCGAGVLGEDRRGAHKRGRGDRVWGVGFRRIALVPRTWGNANSRAGSVYGALPVLQ